jgi:nucleoside phosphorylase
LIIPEADMETINDRKMLARYLLSRGEDAVEAAASRVQLPSAARALLHIPFPDGLRPTPAPIDPPPESGASLPNVDVVVITWTVDEHDALRDVFTPGIARSAWYPYAKGYAERYMERIRRGAPSTIGRRLGSYFVTRIGRTSVLCFKSELHLNQDGIRTGEGTATLPVKDLFLQIMDETRADVILTVGTAGSVHEDVGLGDVVVTRAAKFRLSDEFRNEAFNGQVYTSEWVIPDAYFGQAEVLMNRFAPELEEPPFGPPTTKYEFQGGLAKTEPASSAIKLDGRDMSAFHPILTTDYFEFGTSTNHLEEQGSGVEMGDAALGLACAELDSPPLWAVIRNMSDPQINGDLPTSGFRLNQQTVWAVAYYEAYGYYTSVAGAIATWAVIAGLDAQA